MEKSIQKSHRKSQNLDPCNPNFFHDKSLLEVACFLNHHNYTVSGSGGGGDEITLQNLPNYDEFKPLKLVPCDEIKPL